MSLRADLNSMYDFWRMPTVRFDKFGGSSNWVVSVILPFYSSYCSWTKVKLIIIMHFVTNIVWCGYQIRPQLFLCVFEPKFARRSSLNAGDWAQDCQGLFLDHFLGKINAFLKPKKSNFRFIKMLWSSSQSLQVKSSPQYLILHNLPRKLNNFATI